MTLLAFKCQEMKKMRENNEVLYILLFHLSTIFFSVIALAWPYENDYPVFMLSLKMSFPSFSLFLFFLFFLFLCFLFSFLFSKENIWLLKSLSIWHPLFLPFSPGINSTNCSSSREMKTAGKNRTYKQKVCSEGAAPALASYICYLLL